jgi:alpha-glucosidase
MHGIDRTIRGGSRDFGEQRRLREAETQIGGHMPLFFFDNHDNPRSLTRYGDGKHNPEIARLLATLLLTPRCAALLYYGQEIGMENNDPKRKEDVRDPVGRTGWPKEKGRDGERTPMQWDSSANAGFSTSKTTWLPVAPNYTTRNVAAEAKAPDSLLNYYKAILRLRKTNAALRDGDFMFVNDTDKNVLAFVRKAGGQAVLVALNFTSTPQTARFELAEGRSAVTLISSFSKGGQSNDLKALTLPPFGSFVGQVQYPAPSGMNRHCSCRSE